MAPRPSTVVVTIKADTRPLRRQLALARLSLERSWWRRMLLRLELGKISVEGSP